jgi:hypothetical protein
MVVHFKSPCLFGGIEGVYMPTFWAIKVRSQSGQRDNFLAGHAGHAPS